MAAHINDSAIDSTEKMRQFIPVPRLKTLPPHMGDLRTMVDPMLVSYCNFTLQFSQYRLSKRQSSRLFITPRNFITQVMSRRALLPIQMLYFRCPARRIYSCI
jgi:hypothetical protein